MRKASREWNIAQREPVPKGKQTFPGEKEGKGDQSRGKNVHKVWKIGVALDCGEQWVHIGSAVLSI